MKSMKKLLAILLVVCLAFASLMACGNEEGSQGTGSTAGVRETAGDNDDKDTVSNETAGEAEAADGDEDVEWDEEPAQVTWMMWNVGGSFNEAGLQAVEDAINEITLKKINVQVDLQLLEMGTYLSQMPMQVGAGDKIDLISTFPAAAGAFNSMVNAGQLLPLDELLEEYAPETLETVPESVLKATTVDGQIYAIPVYTDNTNDLAWICRESYLTEAGFSIEDIKTVDDITKVFEKVYELHPDMKMISSGAKSIFGSAGVLLNGVTYDTLGTTVLGVMVDEDAAKVVSLYETDEFKDIAATLRDWYEKGYVDKDIMVREDDPTSDNTVFSFLLAGNKTRTRGSEALAGEPLASAIITEGCISTGTMTILTTAIPVCATEPEAAAALLNLCYTDKDLKMLVSYGIEGQNYEYAENGGISVKTDSSYAPNLTGIFGNVLLCDPTVSEVDMNYKMSDVDMDALNYSPLLGFSVDTDPISNEVSAISSVYTEYQGLVYCGLADEATYQEFIDKLYANGLQVYMDEVQRQLDEWMGEQK